MEFRCKIKCRIDFEGNQVCRLCFQKPSKMAAIEIQALMSQAIDKIVKQCFDLSFVLYYGFSGQGIQINLSCIDEIKLNKMVTKLLL